MLEKKCVTGPYLALELKLVGEDLHIGFYSEFYRAGSPIQYHPIVNLNDTEHSLRLSPD